jgi:3-phosphoshikimate 1-carboxyvinyltransferase
VPSLNAPAEPGRHPAGAAGLTGDDWRPPAATGAVDATVTVPGSKSMTNRALILAALSDNPAVITGPLLARDTALMAAALRTLGAEIDATDPVRWLVTPGQPDGPAAEVDVGNAGTVMRFLPAVAALTAARVRFTGDPQAGRRPVRPLLDALRGLGAQISDEGPAGLPFVVHGRGAVPGGRVILDASGSSQFVSGLLLAAARFGKGAEIVHEGAPLPSLPHIELSVAMLRDAGAEVDSVPGPAGRPAASEAPRSWRVQPGALRTGTIAVQPDLSAAVPFLAAAMVTGGSVTIAGWPERTTQPAGPILDVLTEMGAQATAGPGGLHLTGTGQVHGLTADLGHIGELTPVLTALAALADSPSVFTGVGHLRGHETDRLAALAAEIGALGGDVIERADGLEIRPRPLRPGAAPFRSHDDHRMVMAAAVLGLAVPGLTVAGAATVGKTFPGFPAAWRAMLAGPR